MRTANAAADGAGEYPLGRAWYAVILLTLLYIMSYIDRLILALLIDPLGSELHVSDTQAGLLVGLGFAVVYSLAGLPLAQMLDRGQRRLIVVGGVLTWSTMTVASGFAPNFELLLLFRAGVAVGEAVLTPAAISMIADMYPPQRRALPVSTYASVSTYMGVGAFIVGGAAFDLAQALEPMTALAPWRGTLVILGLPGLVLGLLFLFTVREPPRRASAAPEDAEGASVGAFLRHFKEHALFYAPLTLGIGTGSTVMFGVVSWLPTLLARAYDFDPAVAGYAIGLAVGPFSLSGAFLWPWFAGRISGKGRVRALTLCLASGTAIALPFILMAPNLKILPLLFIGVGFTAFFHGCYSVLGPLTLQAYGPGRMQARLTAISLLCSNIIGFGVAPVAVPLFAKFWPNDPHALGYGMATLAAIAIPISTLLFATAFWTAKRKGKASLLIGET
ncbi:MAG: MFS transporter [Hyphomonadaceae bacterium]